MPFADPLAPRSDEITAAKTWMAANLGPDEVLTPFSFHYDGETWNDGRTTWSVDRVATRLDKARTQHTLTYFDRRTGLEVQCVATEYHACPVVEWVVYFENKGHLETPIVEAIQSADVIFSGRGPFVLHHADGSHAEVTDFQPRRTELVPEQTQRFAPYGGRSSDGVLPFFNIVMPQGDGIIAAVGWTGQWAASFTPRGESGLSFEAGLERTHLKLLPGERIRVPAILLLFYTGDWIRGQNLLRRFLLDHAAPRPGGSRVDPPVAVSPHATIGFEMTTEANMRETIAQIASHELPVDTFWIDAGWYTCPDADTGERNWAKGVGNWDADTERYPNGIQPVAAAAHDSGLRFLLWFEPERVMPDTWLYDNHPDWLLAPTDFPAEQQYQAKDGFHLLNLGHPEALAWLKDKVSGMIGAIGVDIYRHDFNLHPLHYWRSGEAPDRQGINEIRYITGLYDFFDALAADHSHLLIDSCASGGRRLDFEMQRRSLALWRSDLCWEPTAEQCMTYALSLWIPLHGVGSISLQPYDFRSGMGSTFSLALDYQNPSIWAGATRLLEEYQSVRHFFAGDFYPLTSYSVDDAAWIAWQFDRADLGAGMVQAFRREQSDRAAQVFCLRGLDAEAVYEWRDLDSGTAGETPGDGLMGNGLEVLVNDRPGAAIITYRRIR